MQRCNTHACPVGALLIHANVKCNSRDAMRGTLSSAAACADAVKAAGGTFFIFGKGRKSGKCWHEFTASSSCTQGFRKDDYDFYKVAAEGATTAVLTRAGGKCNARETYIATAADASDCARQVEAKGGMYFSFGTGRKAGKCYQEHTRAEHCPEGFVDDNYDFYKVGRVVASPIKQIASKGKGKGAR